MFYGDTIQDTRQMFFNSWSKYQQKSDLLPLEKEIVNVILAHPEYHSLVENKAKFEQEHFSVDRPNPFLHMGLHLAVREQVAMDRPTGIQALYAQLLAKFTDSLEVEHLIMEQLAECLWFAQKNNAPPDEVHYLHVLKTKIS